MSEDAGGTALADQPEPERVGKFTPPREAVVDLLAKRLRSRLQTVDVGGWDGVQAVTSKDLEEALSEPLPPASDHAAEIETPGWLTVAAVCRRCGIASDIGVDLDTETKTTKTGTEIAVKGKSKARTHVCFQTTLAGAAEEQGAFDLSDIVGEPAETEEGDEADDALGEPDPETADALCPFPGCALGADHKGKHVVDDSAKG